LPLACQNSRVSGRSPRAETGFHQLNARYLARHGMPEPICALVAGLASPSTGTSGRRRRAAPNGSCVQRGDPRQPPYGRVMISSRWPLGSDQ
jgi:hypothetical protein